MEVRAVLRRCVPNGRTNRLVARGAAIERAAPLTKVSTETAFYDFAERVFTLPEVTSPLIAAVNVPNAASRKGKGSSIAFLGMPNGKKTAPSLSGRGRPVVPEGIYSAAAASLTD